MTSVARVIGNGDLGRWSDRLSAHLRWAGSLVILFIGTWLLVTQSLPYAVASQDLQLARWLNPDHPATHLAEARDLRDGWLRRISADDTADSSGIETDRAGAFQGSDLSSVQTDAAAVNTETRTRERIVVAARSVLAREPLNAEAHRLLGEMSADLDLGRRHMQAAVARSRRESAAVFWLLNDSFVRGATDDVIRFADVLLRTRPQLRRAAVVYLGRILATEDGVQGLTRRLADTPPWRRAVLAALPANGVQPDDMLSLLLELNRIGAPPTPEEKAPFLRALVAGNNVPAAYAAWLQLLPTSELEQVRLLTNGSFDVNPTPVPFDWQVRRPSNASYTFDVAAPDGLQRAFQVGFGPGRIRFPELRQVLVLGPGTYALNWRVKGRVIGKRGLVWEVHCRGGAALQTSDMIRGNFPEWRPLAMRFQVPDGAGCEAQTLMLRHDARSASEQFMTGLVTLDDVTILRIEDTETQPQEKR